MPNNKNIQRRLAQVGIETTVEADLPYEKENLFNEIIKERALALKGASHLSSEEIHSLLRGSHQWMVKKIDLGKRTRLFDGLSSFFEAENTKLCESIQEELPTVGAADVQQFFEPYIEWHLSNVFSHFDREIAILLPDTQVFSVENATSQRNISNVWKKAFLKNTALYATSTISTLLFWGRFRSLGGLLSLALPAVTIALNSKKKGDLEQALFSALTVDLENIFTVVQKKLRSYILPEHPQSQTPETWRSASYIWGLETALELKQKGLFRDAIVEKAANILDSLPPNQT